MSDQTIQSRDVSIDDLFKDFYFVPHYQREFVWNQDNVEQFLEDIDRERTDSIAPPEYFIGSIVVCRSKDGTDGKLFELIDGQQRMTTLFLILCALRSHLKKHGKSTRSIDQMIYSVFPDSEGIDQERQRLELQYEDSRNVLKKIAEETWPEVSANGKTLTTSIRNIDSAYKSIRDFFAKQFDTVSAVQKYYGYLSHKVKLIRIETEDVAKALMIFETINDRGVGLDAMDLLKNLLFMKAKKSDFEQLKFRWEELKNIISDMKEKPLRFLRYFILSNYDIDALRQDEIYKTILKNESNRFDYEKHPLKFTNKLIESAKAYRHFTNSRDVKENNVPYLENITYFAGRAAKQHFILLLAGRHLESGLFSTLSKEIENIFFVHIVTHQQTNALEGKFAKWANEIRKIKTQKGLNNFLKKELIPAKNKLSARFSDSFIQISQEEIKKKNVLRYVLDKLAQFIDMSANQTTEERLDIYKEKYEIEHIHPQEPSDEANREFGDCPEGTINMLGNLTLLEKPRNRHLQNKPFSEKKAVYVGSSTLLTRTIVEKVKVGKSSITRAVEDLESYDEWNHKTVQQRQIALANLAHKVWNVEKPKQSPSIEPASPSTPKEDQIQNISSDSTPTHIKVFDRAIEVRSWRDAMVKFLIAIYGHDPEALYSLVEKEQREPKIRRSPSQHKTHVPTKIGDSGLWINKHGSAAGIRKKCREIEGLLGYKKCSLLTFMSDDQPHNIQT